MCGTTINSDAVLELEFGDFMVIFRSSEDIRGEGFELYAICFRPEEADLEGLLDLYCSTCTHYIRVHGVFGGFITPAFSFILS